MRPAASEPAAAAATKIGTPRARRASGSRIEEPLAGLALLLAMCSAVCAAAAFLWVLEREPSGLGAAARRIAGILVLLAPALRARSQPSSPPRRLAALAVLASGLGLLAVSSAAHVALGALAAATTGFLVDGRRRPRLAPWAFAFAPALALAALAREPDSVTLTLFPAALGLATAGRLTLGAARGERGARLFWAGALTLAALLLLPPLEALLAAVPNPVPERLRPRAGASSTESQRARGDRAPSRSAGARAFEELFPGAVGFRGAADPLEHEPVLIARPAAGAADPSRPLYLRGLVLDRITDAGIEVGRADEPAILRDADDGRADGWTTVAAGPSDLELTIRQRALAVRQKDTEWSVLFAPQPVRAVALPAVGTDHDGLLVDVASTGEWIEWRVRAAERRATHVDLRGRRPGAPGERWLQLPPASPDLDRLRARAVELAGDARGLEAVERILAHLGTFDYATRSTALPGLAGVLDFLDRRRGHCTYFAAAAVLCLRARGMPARVATGFLAQDWSAEQGAFLVTTQNGHAWIEVHVEGLGWVTFDPTPLERRRVALAAATEVGPDFGAWLEEAAFELGLWVRTRGREPGLGRLVTVAAESPIALGRSLGGGSPAAWGAVLALAALVLALRARRRTRPRTAAPERHPTPSEGRYARLVTALARAGHRRRPSQTPLEFARAVAAREDALADLVGVTESLYALRWGAHGEVLGLEQRIDALLGRVEAGAPVVAP